MRATLSISVFWILLSPTLSRLDSYAQRLDPSFAYLSGHSGFSIVRSPVLATAQEFLDSVFFPHSVPQAEIPVLNNALGDVVHDSVINVLDLLRLRDITIGKPPAPTSYELLKGDLTVDGTVDAADLNLLRDILLHKASVPYLVGSGGGQVLGEGITLTIPPGAVDSTIVFSVDRQTESEFASGMGVDTKGAVQDSSYFMASFKITSTTPNFKLPVNATIKLDSVPPCAYQGLNGLFAAVPDRDGDGRTELFLINELKANGDSLTITTADIPIPSIQSLSASTLQPGQSLIITGSGFGDDPQSVIVRFTSMANADSFQNLIPEAINDTTLIVTMQNHPSGQGYLTMQNLRSGVNSKPHPFEIQTPNPFAGDIRFTIVNFLMGITVSMDSISSDSLFSDIEDSTVHNYLSALRTETRSSIDSEITFYVNLADSLLYQYASIAAFIQNMPTAHERATMLTAGVIGCEVCNKIYGQVSDIVHLVNYYVQGYYQNAALCAATRDTHCEYCERAEIKRWLALNATDMLGAVRNILEDCVCRNCAIHGPDCGECKNTVFIGYGPQGQKISGGFGPNGWGTKGCCVNIKKYKSNQCISVPAFYNGDAGSPVPIKQPEELKCPPAIGTRVFTHLGSIIDSFNIRPHPGSIIKVTNASVPYNIVGILNDNGKAFIPHVPMNTKVTFSMYDPVSGLYDPDAGTYITGSTPGGFDRPILLFKPNTQIRSYSIKIGEPKHDSVSLDMQRIDYLLNIAATDTSKLLNIGFNSSAQLSLKIEDPQGYSLFDNTDVACYSNVHLRFTTVGVYRIRIAIGTAIQPGLYSFGISYYPDAPLGKYYMCGKFLYDTLYERLSPYLLQDPVMVSTNDTVVVEAGVNLLFDHGGSILSNGVLVGNGSPAKPIKLKPASQMSTNRTLSIGGIIKNPFNQRKEVQP